MPGDTSARASVLLLATACTQSGLDTPLDGVQRPLGAADLPAPRVKGSVSLEQALSARRSIREWRDDPLPEGALGQLLWAAQGVTHGEGNRTAPSAGATYPLEVYAATPEGVYHYVPDGHRLELFAERDVRVALTQEGEGKAQDFVARAPVVVAIAGVKARTAKRYGARAGRYVALEAGHAAQNLLLQAVALGLGAVPVGAFNDEGVGRALGLPGDQTPLYLIPVGVPADP